MNEYLFHGYVSPGAAFFNQTLPEKFQSRSRSRSKTVCRSIEPWFEIFNQTL